MLNSTEKLRILMARKNITMAQMAEKTGQSRQNLSNKFARSNFTEKDLKEMASVLGCTVNIQFVDEEGNVVM
ncbi:MAG: helix-turn-helix transcriptional regulator [Phascolarctobacterium sp.]|nr:helix-turn-helix transcriptional regulator [Phascolarctobacterium sp.]MBR6636189.1 helix-turn-helix transcriptional regulator [Phascolarctobacterium sp.]